MRLRLLLAAAVFTGLPVHSATSAENDAAVLRAAIAAHTERPSLRHYNLGRANLALEGYDPVAYFPEGGGAARKGRKRIAAEHRGVWYRFSSRENLERFRLNPDRYEPAYGGWGSYAMTKGEKARVNPTAFLVQDGRLHVFYKGIFTDNRLKWKKEPAALAGRANAFWKRISGEGSAEGF